MALELKQVQALKQQLQMTPQLQQAIKLLQYNQMELESFLRDQLEENGALEEGARKEEAPLEERTDERVDESDEIDWDDYLANAEMGGGGTSGLGTSGYADLPSIEETHAETPDLTAHLMQQLIERLDVDEEEQEIARAVIFSLDDQGFFRDTTFEELATAIDVDPIDIEDALALVQEFEPVGVAARDLSECLYLQVVAKWPRDRLLKDVVRYHLDDLQAGRDKKLSRALDLNANELAMIRKRVQQLDPFPAREFAPESPTSEYITPDVRVLPDGDSWTVVLSDESLPQMHIASYYRETLRGGASPEAKAYVREKLNSASFLIRSIEQRRRTIRRVAQAIVDVQSEYFVRGPAALQPLVLQDIADVVEMHESTISRVTRGKYMDTPRGTLEFKYFFNVGIPVDGGGEVASEAVRYQIGKLIESEDRRKPLSDSSLADELQEQHGIRIARRTVAKYREGLGIPSSTKRRLRS